MRTVEVKVYTVRELSAEATAVAHKEFLKWQSEGYDNPWHKDYMNSLNAFEKLFGVNVLFPRGILERFRVEVPWEEHISAFKGIRLVKYLVNNYWKQLYEGKYYSTPGYYDEHKKYHYKFRHSNCTFVHDCVMTGCATDDEILDLVYDTITYQGRWDELELSELMEQCVNQWQNSYIRAVEEAAKLEFFLDYSESNDYEYTEHGHLFVEPEKRE